MLKKAGFCAHFVPNFNEMKLTTKQAHTLLEKYGSYVAEVCDACGQSIGAIRFTSKGEAGVWCSRVCRNGKDAHAPGTCKGCGASLAGERKGTKFCHDTCRVRFNRRSQTSQDSTDTPRILKALKDTGSGLGCLYTNALEKRCLTVAR